MRDLVDRDTVLDVCVRVNDIIDMAGLPIVRLDLEVCSCADLFEAVRAISEDERIVSFSEAVAGLNGSLKRLATKNGSLEDRLVFLSQRIDDTLALAGRLSAVFSAELATRARLSDIKDGKLVIQKNGVTVAEFTANQSADVSANILADVPAWGNITGDLTD